MWPVRFLEALFGPRPRAKLPDCEVAGFVSVHFASHTDIAPLRHSVVPLATSINNVSYVDEINGKKLTTFKCQTRPK